MSYQRGKNYRQTSKDDLFYGLDPRISQPPPPGDQFSQFPNQFYNLAGAAAYDRNFSNTQGEMSWEYSTRDFHRDRYANQPPYRSSKFSNSAYRHPKPKSSRNSPNKSITPDKNSQSCGDPQTVSTPLVPSGRESHTTGIEPGIESGGPGSGARSKNTHSRREGGNSKALSDQLNPPQDSQEPTSIGKLEELLAQQTRLQNEISNHLSKCNLGNEEISQYASKYDLNLNGSTQRQSQENGDASSETNTQRDYTHFPPRSRRDSHSPRSLRSSRDSSVEGINSNRSIAPEGNSNPNASNQSSADCDLIPPRVIKQLDRVFKNCLENYGFNKNSTNLPPGPQGATGPEPRSQDIQSTPRRPELKRDHKVDFRDTYTKYETTGFSGSQQPTAPHCSTPSVPSNNLPGLDPDLLSHVIVDALCSHFQQNNTPYSHSDSRQRNQTAPYFSQNTRNTGQDRPFHENIPTSPLRSDRRTNPGDPFLQNFPPNHRSRLDGQTNCRDRYHTMGNSDTYNLSRPQMVTTFGDTGLEKFSGRTKDYVDFKDLFNIVTEGYPEKYKLLKLRQYLDRRSNAEIAFIHADDEGALEQAWTELDELYGQGRGNAEYHVSQVMAVMTWRPCENQADLERLYTHLKTHLAMAQRAGDKYRQQTEGLAHFMSNILYGWSQDKVIELKINRPSEFCMDKIMDYIKRAVQHDRLKSRETKGSISKQRPQQPNFYKGRDMYQRSFSRERNDSGNFHNKTPYNNINNNNNNNNNNNRDTRSYQQSPKSPQSSQRPSRSPHRNPDRYPRDRSNSGFRSDYSDTQQVSTFNLDTKEKHNFQQHRRANSPHPRGARAKSPARSPNGRLVFRCLFCKNNEHLSMNCTQTTSENALHTARNERLCFVCLTGGHQTFQCPASSICESSTCTDQPVHGKLLCKAFQEKQ